MSHHELVKNVARAIYEYAGKDDIPRWESLAPTIQIYYIEQAEASLEAVCRYLESLACGIDSSSPEEFLVQGTVAFISRHIDPKILDE